jgi:hypothetical protein
MKVFISHISEEAPVASCLKDWIESSIVGCDVFVSSDSAALPAGTRWLNELDTALRQADVLMVVCSAASLQRPWVNFESGCAWARGIPIMPLCHSGSSKGSLPRPLGEFQGIDLVDPSFPRLLLEALKKHFKLPRSPRIHEERFAAEVAAAIAAVQPSQPVAAAAPPIFQPSTTEPSGAGDLVLEFLAEENLEGVEADTIAERFKWGHHKSVHELDELASAKLLRRSLKVGYDPKYLLTEAGRRYMAQRGMLR